MRLTVVAIVAALIATPAPAQDRDNVAAWVQYAPGGGVEARVVTKWSECPRLSIDGSQTTMQERAAPNGDFPLRVCALPIPLGARKVSVLEPLDRMVGANSQRVADLPLPVANPLRIMVFGDTGCRIKGGAIQDCNDPAKWPFPQIAAQAAKLKPDLVIHVGDYLYRESACPDGDKRCEGTPHGDNWPSWDADFFAPAAPLLAVAPWVIVRGNHEDCQRAGPGWLRLLGPNALNPVAGCMEHIPLYTVPLGDVNLAVMDNTDAPDTTIDTDVRTEYEADFNALAKEKTPLWLVAHRPIWGAVTLYGAGMGGNRTLIATLPSTSLLARTSLMLAGHIHTFEALNYDDRAIPPQLIAGFGGDALDAAPTDLSGLNLSGTRVKDGISIGGFGFLMLTRVHGGWRIDVHKVDGTIEKVCRFANRRLDCPKA
ncbi:MAG TPA: metallophosphoesterase [Rhizomicrobium sp.]|nr:metallophosphoesterase [Rhizomicrobium sp.]